MRGDIDTHLAAARIVAELRALECDVPTAREILALCQMRITCGDLGRDGASRIHGAKT